MGMGEPLLNESPVYDACELLLDDWAFGLSRRRVTVSSSGIVPALLRMSDKVNLIPFNPFPETKYQTSKESTIDKFQDVLFRSGIRTTTRRTRGDDVDAACGQLAGKVLDKSRRNAGRNQLLS
jgi:adenine C2-methylase RlmN of 23S rRNA A2503 and tRNA A37